ncbi:unnamed protein product [Haemonchus placei]|uniref:Reverse transcriptase/retrotransposon-derived protein RNase H-like domain-containing protein n=1 Tax=Haemonchus placei TaxID=6290 RepID=A0A3P7TSD0_HAEPC|nr:unnamed protein product [Haemonchus placei]
MRLATTACTVGRIAEEECSVQMVVECRDAFQRAKDVLASDLLFTHYDPTKEIVIAADASEYGLGAVISHRLSEGAEKAIHKRQPKQLLRKITVKIRTKLSLLHKEICDHKLQHLEPKNGGTIQSSSRRQTKIQYWRLRVGQGPSFRSTETSAW